MVEIIDDKFGLRLFLYITVVVISPMWMNMVMVYVLIVNQLIYIFNI